jgi:uncharacterized DUF497 family protein
MRRRPATTVGFRRRRDKRRGIFRYSIYFDAADRMANTVMRISFDPVKNARNVAERGLPFQLVADLEWETAVIWPDERRDYGERRMRVLAYLGARLTLWWSPIGVTRFM